MLLRRITKHVKDQNWFAVGIDFVIVVIGVFIGIQVANWNASRTDRAMEAAFLERMAVDVESARAQLAGFLIAREERLQSIAKVENMYLGDGDVVPLSESECSQFAGSHMITHPPVAVPSITEAFAGGRIDLLSDQSLIQALISVEQSEDRLRTIIDSLNLTRPVLQEKYPEVISYTRATGRNANDPSVFANSGYSMSARCTFLDMPPDPAFISDVVLSLQMNQWYVNFLNRHLDNLDELAAALNGAPTSDTTQTETE